MVAEHGGVFPKDRATLLSLPGIGPYTAAAIAAIAYDRAETVVDGNVERVIARLRGIDVPLPAAKTEVNRLAAELTPWPATRRLCTGHHGSGGDDLHAEIARCADNAPGNRAARQTKPAPRPDFRAERKRSRKPIRHGIVYLARRADGAWLLERRPESGLLGGMLGWPTTSWNEKAQRRPANRSGLARPRRARCATRLRISTSGWRSASPRFRSAAIADRGTFHPNAEFRPASLPTVMRKAYDFASREFVGD